MSKYWRAKNTRNNIKQLENKCFSKMEDKTTAWQKKGTRNRENSKKHFEYFIDTNHFNLSFPSREGGSNILFSAFKNILIFACFGVCRDLSNDIYCLCGLYSASINLKRSGNSEHIQNLHHWLHRTNQSSS